MMIVPGNLPLFLCLWWTFLETVVTFKRVCYFTNWSGDLLIQEAHFEISDINPDLCTHIIFAFAKIDTETFELVPTRTDDQGKPGEVSRYLLFNNMKQKHPKVITMLSIGGSLLANTGFGKVVESEEGRKIFAQNCVGYLREWGFDGIDVDWEYPGDPPGTKANFTILLQELRSAINNESRDTVQTKLLLSLAAPVSEELITKGYDVIGASSAVDFINLMAYDFHGPWNQITGLNAPLYPREGDWRFTPDLNVQSAVMTWLERGAPPDKIVVGIAGYGSSYTLNGTNDTSVGAPVAQPGKAGPYRLMEGQLSYYEICLLVRQGAFYQWDDIQKSPYVYINNTWVGFDDEESVGVKVDWMMEQGLGGVMFWSLDLDDFQGRFCDRHKYPLLRSIVNAVARHFPNVVVPPYESTTPSTTNRTASSSSSTTSIVISTTVRTSNVLTTTNKTTAHEISTTSRLVPRIFTTPTTRATTTRYQSTTKGFRAGTPITTRRRFEVRTPVHNNLPPWIPDKNNPNGVSNSDIKRDDNDFGEKNSVNSVAAEEKNGKDAILTVSFSQIVFVYLCSLSAFWFNK